MPSSPSRTRVQWLPSTTRLLLLSMMLLSVAFLAVTHCDAFSATRRTIMYPSTHAADNYNNNNNRNRNIYNNIELARRRLNLPSSLHSSSLEDPEEDPDLTEETMVVSKEPFESEFDVAQKANDMIANQDGNSSVELKSELEASFLQYALSVIMGRALPDARDGLKPVHRRILFAMDQLKLRPTSSHRKCARVVGEVLGKYHPHGDMSVYDALVRMAQDFSTAYMLVDGHGNFGSVDNDPAAAMRYTECRLTEFSRETFMDDLYLDSVDFCANFDGNEEEPLVLPSKLPILLLNGSQGIAVGMATNIPPHNLQEITTACRALIQKERIGTSSTKDGVTDNELFMMVPGPDFPTGATILGKENSRKLYETGNGRVVMRAVTHLEELKSPSGKKSRQAIIVTELPYQVNKASLLEQIANLVNEKKIEGISDLRDESDRDGIRIVMELKMRDAIPSIILANLYKKSKLQLTFNGNMVALMKSDSTGNNDGGSFVPRRFTLRESLDYFLDFRFETIRRKTKHQIAKVKSRIHILDGLLLALEQMDAVIDLVRKSPDAASSRSVLMQSEATAKTGQLALGLSREQADSVLRLQLGQMTRLKQNELSDERNELESRRKSFQNLLDEDDTVYKVIAKEQEDLDKKYGKKRKSTILSVDEEVEELELVKNSRSVIVVTRAGYIKRMELKAFESQKRGTRGKQGSSVDDEVVHCITCNDHDTLLIVTQTGVVRGLPAYKVPTASLRAKGAPLPSILNIKIGESVTAMLAVNEFTEDEYLVLVTKHGFIKRTPLKVLEKITARGLVMASLEEGDSLVWSDKCTDDNDILIGSARGKATRFKVSGMRPTGRSSKGVRSMNLNPGDTIASMNILGGGETEKKECVLVITEKGYGKRVSTDEFKRTARGMKGVISIKFNKAKSEEDQDKVKGFLVVNEDDEILISTSKGVMVRQRVSEISLYGRSAKGILVQKLNNSDKITSISIVPAETKV